MRRSLVTGGAGFIGSHLVEALLDRGDMVRVLDNFSSGKKENLAGILDKIELITADLQDQASLVTALQDIDLVYHQAAFVSGPLSIDEPEKCFAINVNGTVRLLEEAIKTGVKRVVLASSAAVYGDNPAVPLSENVGLDPKTPYATSKAVGELYTRLYSDLLGLEVVALRYFNVFGPRQNPDSDYAAVIPIFVKNILDKEQPTIFGDGHQTRDFIYIDDVVRANLFASEADQAPGKIINICSGLEISLLDLLDSLAEILGTDIQPIFEDERPGDIYRSAGDPTLARELLEYEPFVDLAEGLKKTAAWMNQS